MDEIIGKEVNNKYNDYYIVHCQNNFSQAGLNINLILQTELWEDKPSMHAWYKTYLHPCSSHSLNRPISTLMNVQVKGWIEACKCLLWERICSWLSFLAIHPIVPCATCREKASHKTYQLPPFLHFH